MEIIDMANDITIEDTVIEDIITEDITIEEKQIIYKFFNPDIKEQYKKWFFETFQTESTTDTLNFNYIHTFMRWWIKQVEEFYDDFYNDKHKEKDFEGFNSLGEYCNYILTNWSCYNCKYYRRCHNYLDYISCDTLGGNEIGGTWTQYAYMFDIVDYITDYVESKEFDETEDSDDSFDWEQTYDEVSSKLAGILEKIKKLNENI